MSPVPETLRCEECLSCDEERHLCGVEDVGDAQVAQQVQAGRFYRAAQEQAIVQPRGRRCDGGARQHPQRPQQVLQADLPPSGSFLIVLLRLLRARPKQRGQAGLCGGGSSPSDKDTSLQRRREELCRDDTVTLLPCIACRSAAGTAVPLVTLLVAAP